MDNNIAIELKKKYKKMVLESEIQQLVDDLRKENKKISFTNGCFDIMHAGHIDSLEQSKSFGDVLFVALNTDESVRKYKGNNRPIIEEKYRAIMLLALECVDYVIFMNDTNAANLLLKIKPDYYVKGNDYIGVVNPETNAVNSYGGICKYVPFSNDISTSKIIEKIKKLDL